METRKFKENLLALLVLGMFMFSPAFGTVAKIYVAGYFNSRIDQNGGVLSFFAYSPLTGSNRRCELFYQGNPLCVYLPEVEPGIFQWLNLEISSGLSPMQMLLEMRAYDQTTTQAYLWPYLYVGLSPATPTPTPTSEPCIKIFGGDKYDEGIYVQQTQDGGYIILGTTESFGYGGADIYLIKTDNKGNLKWQKTYGGVDFDWGYSLCQTQDGGYVLLGETFSFGAGGRDVYLIKTDGNGSKKWQRTFGGTGSDVGYCVQQTKDGGYIIVGKSNSFGTGGRDVYLIKTDSNGIKQWEKTYGGSNHDEGKSVKQTQDGGYIIVGSTESFGGGSYDIYLVKTDGNGNLKWQKTYGGTKFETGNGVNLTKDGGYIIVGGTYSYGAGNSDIYLIKTDGGGNTDWQNIFGGSENDEGVSVQQTTDNKYILTGSTASCGAGGNDLFLIKADGYGKIWQKTFGGSENDGGNSVCQTADGGYIIAGYTKSFADSDGDVLLVKTDAQGNCVPFSQE